MNLVNPYRFVSGFDADAQAFIDAVGTLTAPQQTSINNLVVGLKANGTWSKYHAIYPFIGGTAAAHKWNLVNPLDTDGAFRITFNGTWTHNSDGITGDGSTTYANTHLDPTLTVAAADMSFGLYNKSDTQENGCDMGIYVNAATDKYFSSFTDWGDGNFYSWHYTSSGSVSLTSGDSRAYYQVIQSNATTHKVFKDGVQFGSTDTTDTTSEFSSLAFPFFIGAQNSSGSDIDHASKNYAFAYVSDALTDTEAADDYTTVEAFQTENSRNN
ncbi:MAG: hypothetical protein GY928_01880 [Colwellia sp.]|nr:hypothetical protein [Colwellia sp.]